jgi:hypothetical protein
VDLYIQSLVKHRDNFTFFLSKDFMQLQSYCHGVKLSECHDSVFIVFVGLFMLSQRWFFEMESPFMLC